MNSNDKRTSVPPTVSQISIATGQPMPTPVHLECQYLHTKGMVWLLVKFDSYSRERNLIMDISVHGLPINVPELRMQEKAIFTDIEAAVANNAGTYYDDHQELEILKKRVQDGPTHDEKVHPDDAFLLCNPGTTDPDSLMDAILKEMNRVRYAIKLYEDLPGNAGYLGIMVMKNFISRAEKAILHEDIVEMIFSYELLKDCEPEIKEEVPSE